LPFTAATQNGLAVLRFAKPVEVKAGKRLVVA